MKDYQKTLQELYTYYRTDNQKRFLDPTPFKGVPPQKKRKSSDPGGKNKKPKGAPPAVGPTVGHQLSLYPYKILSLLAQVIIHDLL